MAYEQVVIGKETVVLKDGTMVPYPHVVARLNEFERLQDALQRLNDRMEMLWGCRDKGGYAFPPVMVKSERQGCRVQDLIEALLGSDFQPRG